MILFGLFKNPFVLSEKKEKISKRFITRLGKEVEPDVVFDAIGSKNMDDMLKVLHVKTNPIDRHFLLLNIVILSYKSREEKRMRELCRTISEIHIKEFTDIAPFLKEEMGGSLPHVPTFQHYATLLTEDGEFGKAIDVCNTAISFGLHDWTKADYAGRVERIKKKQEEHVNP